MKITLAEIGFLVAIGAILGGLVVLGAYTHNHQPVSECAQKGGVMVKKSSGGRVCIKSEALL